ncbi:MAG: putative DNA binding domain-containing protein [Bacilli bacterium]|nr:putative DNA binding domain-containing protein [Bacilli bacterium]
MLDVIEDVRNEFKVKLTDKFEEEVISFLNTNGGNIYIGINDKGDIVGINGKIDLLQRTIKDRIKDNIMPSTLGLYDVVTLEENGKKYIKVIIAHGSEGPYYIKGMGMTPDSCFIRVGSSIQSMPYDMINNRVNKRTRTSLRNIVSPKQNLTFSQLKIYYEEKGFNINNNFLKQLDLYTDDGKYNYNAYLLADNNTVSIKFGKYAGTNAVDLIENEDFGNCSLIKATKNILNKIEIENKIFTKIEYPERKEIKMYDFAAVREAVVNAIVHNDWSNEYAPKFEMFSDRLVISSNGGIQDSTTKEEFLEGFSLPKNKELMKVFNDLDLVEQMGTGIIRILQSYNKESFEFFPNFIRVTFPFNENKFKLTKNEIQNSNITETQNNIIGLMLDSPTITQETLARLLDVNIRTIQRNIKILMDMGLVERTGATKKGKWIVKKIV